MVREQCQASGGSGTATGWNFNHPVQGNDGSSEAEVPLYRKIVDLLSAARAVGPALVELTALVVEHSR